jgi:TusA-related sulfurtransferase
MNTEILGTFLDITQQICPMTFVRTKLLIESMVVGETATVRLLGSEPLLNVPRSVREHGHKIISLEPETPNDLDGPYLLIIEKA